MTVRGPLRASSPRGVRGAAVTLLVPLLALAAAAPVLAADEPTVTDLNVAASVTAVRPDTTVTALRLAIEPLKQEDTVGNVTTVTLSSDVLFEFGKATLTAPATANIGQVAQKLRGATGPVTVVGHTDAVGAPQDNLALSLARAQTVRGALLAQLPGTAVVIDASGVGEAQPVAPDEVGGTDNPTNRALNRRVVITYTG